MADKIWPWEPGGAGNPLPAPGSTPPPAPGLRWWEQPAGFDPVRGPNFAPDYSPGYDVQGAFNFLGQNRTPQQFQGQYLQGLGGLSQNPTKLSDAQRSALLGILFGTGAAGKYINPLGYSGIFDILQNQGRTDPQAFNRQLADINRTTQQAQDAAAGGLAQRPGLQGSGMGQALLAAIEQGGLDRRAGAIAQENALTENRRRDDLMNLLGMFWNQQLAAAGAQGPAIQPKGPSDLEKAAGYIVPILSMFA